MLFWKKRGEEALQRSGVPYTIVRPGGLLNEPRQGQLPGNIVMTGPNTFGLPPKRTPGSILRRQVWCCICMDKWEPLLLLWALAPVACMRMASTGLWKFGE